MNWIIDRLKEKSTVATLLTGIAGATGWALAPELQEAILATVAGLVSIIAIMTKEEKK
jgi:hypothetical protein